MCKVFNTQVEDCDFIYLLMYKYCTPLYHIHSEKYALFIFAHVGAVNICAAKKKLGKCPSFTQFLPVK